MKSRRSGLLVNVALVLLAVLTLLPLLWMVSASFMPPGAANTLPPMIPAT